VLQLHFTGKATVAVVTLVLIAGALVVLPVKAIPSPLPLLEVLFDLGDGTYRWSFPVQVEPASGPNATWNATLQAASSVGVSVQWTWYACCGAYVTGLGGINPPAGTGLFVWNATAATWNLASVGLSGLRVGGNNTVTTIALSNSAFDSVTYATRYPVPTPDDPYPATQFRYDLANDGAAPGYGPKSNHTLWDRALPLQEIPGTPAVGYGKVFVDTLDGFYALSSGNGSTAWTNLAVKGLSSPALVDGKVLVGGTDGRLHALNATSGTEIWNVTLVTHPLFSGITSSPKVAYDLAYVGTFNETGGPGEVVAVWISNGTVAWRHPTGSIDFSSPAVYDGSVYIGVMGLYNTTTQVTWKPPFGVLALAAATGMQEWFTPTADSVAASPLVTPHLVVVPSKDGYLYALNRTNGSVVWKDALDAGVSSPAISGDTVVVAGGSFGGKGAVHGVFLYGGSVLWTFQPNGPVQASVTVAGGLAYVATNVANGTVYALDVSTGALVWSYTPPNASTSTDYIFSSPVVAGSPMTFDALYVAGDNGHVYAFGTANGPSSSPGPAPLDLVPWAGAAAAVVVVAVAVVYLIRRRKPRGP
jgi:outer membrane protein assembly factor BamB